MAVPGLRRTPPISDNPQTMDLTDLKKQLVDVCHRAGERWLRV
jgi:hypothetical protein